ncbi:hypothetical protein N7493_000575, partial [Penicillium malachiteum]
TLNLTPSQTIKSQLALRTHNISCSRRSANGLMPQSLMSIYIGFEERLELDCLAGSFFFKRNELKHSSAYYVFTTIAAQIAQKLPMAARHI